MERKKEEHADLRPEKRIEMKSDEQDEDENRRESRSIPKNKNTYEVEDIKEQTSS